MEVILSDLDDIKPRKTIFISHANPADNDFAKWLALKLTSLGYTVWFDVLFLGKGKDTWKDIENKIRIDTCKFLVVLSETSNASDGVLKEIAVASKVKKELKDDSFIIPLLIDTKLSFDRINIELNRLNAIDFRSSWFAGLNDLNNALKDYNVPKNENGNAICNEIYNKLFFTGRNTINKDETYNSNWFPVSSLPEYLYFHFIGHTNYDFLKENFHYPYFRYKDYVCTFSEDIGYIFPNLDLFDNNRKIVIPVSQILNRSYDTEFARNFECKNALIRLLNYGFLNMMYNKKLRPYPLSNRKTGFWFEIDQLEKNKNIGVQLVGKRKKYKWHFGISGLIKLVPYPLLIFSSHVFFTEDGKKLVSSKPIQLKLRRKQGANWWNNKWNEKLKSFVKYLSDDIGNIIIPISLKNNIIVSSNSITFLGHLSYTNPKDNVHEEIINASVNNNLDEEYEIEDGII